MSDIGWQRGRIAASPAAYDGRASRDGPRVHEPFGAGEDDAVPRNARRLHELQRRVGLRAELTVVEGVGARIIVYFGSTVQGSREGLDSRGRVDTVDATTP